MSLYPTDDQWAQLLGLSKWCLGGHPQSATATSTAFEVHAIWRAEVEPSFDPPCVLAGILGETLPESEPEDEELVVIALDTIALVEASNSGPLWHKAVLAQTNNAVVFALHSDPVADALNRIELVRAQGEVTLDGIGYRLRFETNSLCGEFSFDNPLVPSLRALEAALNRVAKVAARVSRAIWVEDVVSLWQDYARHGPTATEADADWPCD